MKKNLLIVILLALFSLESHSQATDCCDSLLKIVKNSYIKKTNVRPVNKTIPEARISIQNSSIGNNYAFMPFDSINQKRNPKIRDTPSDRFNWWNDFLKLIIQLLIAVFPLVIAILRYLTQRKKEFDEKITINKRNAYAEFLKNFTDTTVKIMHDKNVDTLIDDKARLYARNKLLLYANDKVIQAYHNWIEYADKETRNIDYEVHLFGKVLLEIRKDILGDSKVSDDEISNLNPFNRG